MLWTRASYYPIRFGGNTPIKIVEFGRDLTAETDLDASRRALASIVDASNDAIIGKALDGAVTSWNSAAEQLFGYTADEVVGRPDDRLLAPEGLAERAVVTARLLRGERVNAYEARTFRKSGSAIVVSISTFAVRDDSGSVVGLGEIVRDITERKQAEAALLHLKQALDEHSIVVTTDIRGKITSVNDRFCEIFQYSRDEVLGRDHRVVNSGHHPRTFWSDLWRTIQSGRIWKGEVRDRAKDGSYRWMDTTILPVRDESGTLSQFVAVRTDITDRRHAVALLEQAARDAETRNTELARAHAESLAATKAKSAFLASISHEIRTPMNAIVGMADLLAESLLQPQQEDYVRRLGRASASLLDLVNDVLDLSKIEAEQVVIESAVFDLHSLLDDVAELLAIRVQEKRLAFIVSIHPDTPDYVLGDQTRLRQVLVNLAGNAVKFTKRGEVVVRVEPVLGTDGRLRTRFAVSDTGIGIPADKLERIFESFTQVDASTTRKYGGTGLGLSISRRLVNLMGGGLSVVSAPGCGSTFSFDIELNRAEPTATVTAVIPLRNQRVLLVDHHETSRQATRARLEWQGMSVIEVVDGASALAALEDAHGAGSPPAVVLVEQDLPAMSGLSLAGAIRARAAWVDLPIVIYASEMRQGIEEALRELGIADYVPMPLTRRRLLAALSLALGSTPHIAGLEPLSEASAPAPLSPDPIRVLVVEDAEENREVLAMFLKGGRFQVDLAENGAVGVERFLEGQYDLVLMDMQMPIMDGYQATSAIRLWERQQGRTPVPVVAITANAFPEDVDRALDAGCSAHIAKPVRKAVLLKAVADHTHRRSDEAA